MGMHVSVDPDLCIGSGDCARLCPDAFKIDDGLGVSVPLPGAAHTESDRLVEAARGCPTQAIHVQHDDGTVLYEGG